ncbi:unnamed protein product [Dicrocoelium dendriticum]|nr:unnamed protein product [Dicrocoelium dendriticum]
MYFYCLQLAGWRQNVDLQCLHGALNKIGANGCTSLFDGLQRTFRMLNLNRLQLGLENYGMGMFPSYIEPAVILCITDGCGDARFHESVPKDVSSSSIESSVFGQILTDAHFRWDYRLYSIVLQYPAFSDNIGFGLRFVPKGSPLLATAELTGGRGYIISDNRELQQCLESLVPKCQPAVVVDFITDYSSADRKTEDPSNTHKQLVFVKLMGRVCSSWPIPESFWPDDEMLSTHLPPRPAHPKIFISSTQTGAPTMPEYFPIDRYELEPSSLTKQLGSCDPSKIWPCFGADCRNIPPAPFGYIKVSPDLQSTHLHVLPYNYPVFCQLLNELYEVHHMRMSEAWGHRFVSYLSNIPRYYFMPLTKAFERFGFQSVIKPEAIDRVLPYQLKHSLQKLRHIAKIEYDNFVRLTQSEESSSRSVLLPATLLPFPMWPLREIRSGTGRQLCRSSTQPYVRAQEINRHKLRSALRKMKLTLDGVLSGRQNEWHLGSVHQQPVALMGDYMNYKALRQIEQPLRELNPAPERLDTFGNPFRKKSAGFVVDELFVDEMGSSAVPGGANVSIVCTSRKKYNPVDPSSPHRNKGPLPHYINHMNWRQFSPKHRHSSPNLLCDGLDKNGAPDDLPSGEKTTVDGSKQTLNDEQAFAMNREVVRNLVAMIKQSCADGGSIFHLLNDLTGTIGERYAAISVVMSEALRFKRSTLYFLLKDWRTCVLRNGTSIPPVGPEQCRHSHVAKLMEIRVNGWG